MTHYPDHTRRRGRPLRNPSQDQRTPEEISWWDTHVSEPNRAHAKPLPLDAPLPDKLPDAWILNTEKLLEKLEKCRDLVMNIPISSLGQTQLGIRYALTEICNLQETLRSVLELHREAQQRFAKHAQPVQKRTASVQPADAKLVRIRA